MGKPTDDEKTVISLPDPKDLPKRKLQPLTRKKPPSRLIRHGLTTGNLPAGCKYIEIRVASFRNNLEQAVLESKGEISITDASCINTALKWERHGLLANRWLRISAEKMNPSDVIRFSKEVAEASDKRDKAIQRLGLDKNKALQVIEALYGKGTA